jgi:7,8-dihydropterin-6-yl-methyl-4-(beta-D-ribofuranosyl)aminobenzene 5'-phosphate synthase
MKVTVLSENTEGFAHCPTEHGLCFCIETGTHKLLFDTGASDLFIKNAEALNIDLKQVDTVVLSPGHYGHGGGIPYFLALNDHAKIYVPAAAFGPYYSIHTAGPKYIGLPQELSGNPRLITCEHTVDIDPSLRLFSDITVTHPIPSANDSLKVKDGEQYIADDFVHEQCLVITENGHRYLFSGCAHHGIRNILDRFRELYRTDPDAVFGGFHMMKKHGYTAEDIDQIIETALALKKTSAQYYTCHCTGTAAYEGMKKIMEKQLNYLHSGDSVILAPKKMHGHGMSMHRFFAWGTVVCFALTMITGYKRK